jgi:4-hydroxybenzoate polyprenyltransferase
VVLSISLGYGVIYYERTFQQIPVDLVYAILLGVTLGFSIKDINDIEADRRNGVITLPVILYRNNSIPGRLPFSFMIGSGFLFFGVFLPEVFPGAVICSIITFSYTLFSTKPREWIYFLLLYLFSIYLLFSLIL